ncbi:hypothetical protein MANI_021361 [Metarhizium anisopliae]|nr:hypothetical protein MANI_021361 [Metarhizium anisopliae]
MDTPCQGHSSVHVFTSLAANWPWPPMGLQSAMRQHRTRLVIIVALHTQDALNNGHQPEHIERVEPGPPQLPHQANTTEQTTPDALLAKNPSSSTKRFQLGSFAPLLDKSGFTMCRPFRTDDAGGRATGIRSYLGMDQGPKVPRYCNGAVLKWLAGTATDSKAASQMGNLISKDPILEKYKGWLSFAP